jgi:hypothetical protein
VDFLTRDASAREGPPVRTRNCRTVATILLLALAASVRTAGAGQFADEYELKAAFLYKFASFIEWPAEMANGPMCIGVIGEDPFGAVLDEVVKGKAINGRPFRVVRFRTGQDASRCQIVFLSAPEQPRLRTLLEQLRRAAVLTVSDRPDFCQNGGIINFEILDNRLHFEINLEAAERAGLKISSKLLMVAKVTREGAHR